MISILIVEDNSSKISVIREILNEYHEISLIHIASDTNNARRLLDKNKYDLLILDLVLPNDFGDETSPENGIDFLKEIILDPNKKRPFHIIGLSEYSEFINQYSVDFKKHLWYLINYNENEEEWKDILRNKLEYLSKSKNEINIEKINSYDFDVAVINAIPKELEKVLKLPCKWKETQVLNDETIYYIGQIQKTGKTIRIVAACAPQMGMCASSTLTMKLINNFRPKYIAMTGIAAGIKGEVQLGDILIADQVWDGASGKLRSDKDNGILFLPDPKSKTLDVGLKEKLLHIKSSRKYLDKIRNDYPSVAPLTILDIHIGPMASVPGVIQSEVEIEKIKAHSRKLIGIEMETYGVFYSAEHCKKPKPIAISIKSVSDFASQEKNDSCQDYATYTSASFLYELILNELDL